MTDTFTELHRAAEREAINRVLAIYPDDVALASSSNASEALTRLRVHCLDARYWDAYHILQWVLNG
jgi:hypothetical protein